MANRHNEQRTELAFNPVCVINGVTEARTPVCQKIGCRIRWNYDYAYVYISDLDRLHQMREIIRQEVAPCRNLKFNPHAHFDAVVANALRPVDTA